MPRPPFKDPPTDVHVTFPRLTRRRLLQGASVLPMVAGALSQTACGADHERSDEFDALPKTREGKVIVGQFDKKEDALAHVAKELDFSWLSRGDSVLLKLASNSAKPHPATTLPDAVVSMVKILKDKGAGRVVVADQAGIEWVRYRANGNYLTDRTTLKVFEENGLLQAIQDAGGEPHTFDGNSFETGYFQATPPRISHWSNGIFVPNILREIDHIIYLPRLSAHAVTGYTMGLKVAVGWMRDDTRMEFHQKGKSLYEKYTQVSYTREIREKFRMSVTWVKKMLLDIGPDFGTVLTLPESLVVASTHLGDHDVVGSQLLLAHDDATPSVYDLAAVYPAQANHWNKYLVEYWGSEAVSNYEPHTPAAFWQGVAYDPSVRHSYVLDGEAPKRITIKSVGTALSPNVLQALDGYDGGLLKVERA